MPRPWIIYGYFASYSLKKVRYFFGGIGEVRKSWHDILWTHDWCLTRSLFHGLFNNPRVTRQYFIPYISVYTVNNPRFWSLHTFLHFLLGSLLHDVTHVNENLFSLSLSQTLSTEISNFGTMRPHCRNDTPSDRNSSSSIGIPWVTGPVVFLPLKKLEKFNSNLNLLLKSSHLEPFNESNPNKKNTWKPTRKTPKRNPKQLASWTMKFWKGWKGVVFVLQKIVVPSTSNDHKFKIKIYKTPWGLWNDPIGSDLESWKNHHDFGIYTSLKPSVQLSNFANYHREWLWATWFWCI